MVKERPSGSARHNPHFFAREADGTVRLRIRFLAEEASLIEEAAGTVPLLEWLHKTVLGAAREQVRAAQATRPKVAPPTDVED